MGRVELVQHLARITVHCLEQEAEAAACDDFAVAADAADSAEFFAGRAWAVALSPDPQHVRAREDVA